MFETRVREGVLQVEREGTRWLSTGWDGGPSEGAVAYNVSVPEGWDETDLAAYVDARCERAGFERPGPALLTGVDLEHARRARYGSVEAIATAGVSNPAGLPMEPSGEPSVPAGEGVGTVNLIVGTTRALAPGALANLVAITAEAKAATLLERAGAPGTTTDAVIAACDPAGERVAFTGSATPVGAATRACVREAVAASLDSRYADRALPTVAEAEYGVETTERAAVSTIGDRTGEVGSR
ncbi:adenosylcobinamide amidohydrolase [Halalkalicoccus jeotgali]|uniref:Adenosylcobinamide amidohydrolase n=1 Tax=Halalkalicoccus jeotgali (strain DSM 18796 / CECT 7217 / JCM 14584 / KCTC 4019 / B3) TaxID=795797 RepID=D8J6Y8_HALJB|nr:adenosylcobinamide amidohydrolase [Halalkalicoccus jeotgali]ADJ15941.1 adenosylcobinamide amidohydrolase [Halalkalicoccus jeotgali B3]ELY38037.1 adenosylcobinamide amidohydrolase [Halalkalicoccus jeotgali B3]